MGGMAGNTEAQAWQSWPNMVLYSTKTIISACGTDVRMPCVSQVIICRTLAYRMYVL